MIDKEYKGNILTRMPAAILVILCSIIGIYMGIFFDADIAKSVALNELNSIKSNAKIDTYTNKEVAEATFSPSEDMWFVIDNYHYENGISYCDSWDVINATGIIRENIEYIYNKYKDSPNVMLSRYNSSIIILSYKEVDPDKVAGTLYMYYDVKTGQRLSMADILTEPDNLCEQIVSREKEKNGDFNDSWIRMVFDSFDVYNLDETGANINFIMDEYVLCIKDKKINITDFVKDEYKQKANVYGSHFGGYYQDGEYKTCWVEKHDIDSGNAVTIGRHYNKQSFEQGIPEIKPREFEIGEYYLIENNDKLFLYVKYKNSAKMLVYDITSNENKLIGKYTGSYFPKDLSINSEIFPMYHGNGTYGWYILSDNGVPQRVDENDYPIEKLK